MKKLIYGAIFLSVTYACSPKTGDNLSKNMEETALQMPISTSIDLANVNEDRVWVEIDPGMFTHDTVTYRIPRVVQGTYDISDFGSFTQDFVAYDYTGAKIDVIRPDENTWIIPNAQKLDKLGYYVNDTFDIENTEKPTPFSPSGTNISEDNFVLNLHGFIGYFEELKDNSYKLAVTAPAGMKKSSALPTSSSMILEGDSTVVDNYTAARYFDITDNPMFYGDLDIEEFQVGDIQIVLSVYSPNGLHSAAKIKETVFEMMQAQKEYLGDMNSTPRYDIYLYLSEGSQTSPQGYGALEHQTSTIVVLPEQMQEPQLNQTMVDVVSHEFFHIVTPLSVHSEDVHYFDYYEPTFSKHLWMYEGVTEYFASHFQVYEDLQPREEFYNKIQGKISSSYTMDDSMSFTELSENVIDEPYASNYYNVYQKGALIGMCIDILMREESNGERSMLSLMKELSAKYGVEKPFEDDNLIAEITEMTYPSVGEFLRTHVEGTTPIDYSVFFDKVGLEMGVEEIQTNLFLINQQAAYINVDQATGKIYFQNMDLNTSLLELGVQPGDTLVTLNGLEANLENLRQILPQSFQWTPDTEVSMTLNRNGEEVKLQGIVGTPMYPEQKLIESDNATDEQIQLRNWWLEK
ncbi:MAG TPA: peptidase M61 [Balneola sp.]|nr:peptidase M61 [Bacteroidota bacterium]HCI71434.1 peptidase M61 [Balneola sp.]HCT51786.1 peptidase M61 [Balneola sp.]|tara:strand:+ start:36350 stop:38245 length:1896 start_codon:yes stop_codon:yes gene_type:complete